MRRLSPPQIKKFQDTVLVYYSREGRVFPWRKTKDPYHILVSEIMLQQTQAPRVVEKYNQFITAFPTTKKLATAKTSDILRLWKGLGYNRRAIYLQKAASQIEQESAGIFPGTAEEMEQLPGVGPYTSAAVMAFAFNRPVVMIETNIRSVYIDHFFRKDLVSDNEILPLIGQTLYRKNTRKWYSALMDYGTMLKKKKGNPSRRSKHHVTQSRFEGSRRQKRGQVLSLALERKYTPLKSFVSTLEVPRKEALEILLQLEKDGLLKNESQGYRLP